MPSRSTTQRARRDLRQGKRPSTAAGEFVREEIEHVREGKHGARSTRQAIAIGLSKARRAGVDLPPPEEGEAPRKTVKRARRDLARGKARKRDSKTSTSRKRSRATKRALKREGHSAASKKALSKQARTAARKRTARSRSASAKKAARTRKRKR